MKASSLFLIAAAAMLTPCALYAGPVVFEQNFNSLTAQLGVTSVGNFTAIKGTNVDIVGAGNGYSGLCAAPESGNCIDLGGTGGNPYGNLQSSAITLGPGTYDLSFDLIGSGRSGYGTTSTTVTLGTTANPGQLYDQSFNNLAYNNVTAGIVNTQFSVAGNETVYLDFNLTATGNPNVGSVLDNVEISSVTNCNAPEPSSLLLLGTGIFALALVARTRTAARRI